MSPDKPHLSREDGGHMLILPKIEVKDRTELSPELARELMKFTIIAGEAMRTVLNKNGVDVARINYQDNDNWREILHIHLYGRAKSAKNQKYGHSLRFPLTKEEFNKQSPLSSLTSKDVADLHGEIARLLNTDEYKNF